MRTQYHTCSWSRFSWRSGLSLRWLPQVPLGRKRQVWLRKSGILRRVDECRIYWPDRHRIRGCFSYNYFVWRLNSFKEEKDLEGRRMAHILSRCAGPTISRPGFTVERLSQPCASSQRFQSSHTIMRQEISLHLHIQVSGSSSHCMISDDTLFCQVLAMCSTSYLGSLVSLSLLAWLSLALQRITAIGGLPEIGHIGQFPRVDKRDVNNSALQLPGMKSREGSSRIVSWFQFVWWLFVEPAFFHSFPYSWILDSTMNLLSMS